MATNRRWVERNGALRVLHVLRAMDYGGGETWILKVMALLDPERVRFDFLCTAEAGPLAGEAERLGGRVFVAPRAGVFVGHVERLRRAIRHAGPPSVVHAHHPANVAAVVAATLEKVPLRVVHSHMSLGLTLRPVPRLIRDLAWRALHQPGVTAGLACSDSAGRAAYGRRWGRDSRFRLLHCGIDLSRFRALDRDACRRSLGLESDELVVLHVGRFVTEKNHGFLLDVISEMQRKQANVRAILVGDGPLRGEISTRVQSMGLSEGVTFLGHRQDVPALLSAADVLLLPSFHEGFGLVVLEAQAAGIPAVVSEAASAEGVVVPCLVRAVPLNAGADKWADEALSAATGGVRPLRGNVDAVRDAGFDIADSARNLIAIYEELSARSAAQ